MNLQHAFNPAFTESGNWRATASSHQYLERPCWCCQLEMGDLSLCFFTLSLGFTPFVAVITNDVVSSVFQLIVDMLKMESDWYRQW